MLEPGYSDALRVLRDAAGGDLQHVITAACDLSGLGSHRLPGDFSGRNCSR